MWAMTVPYVQQVAAPSLCNRGPRGQSRGALHYHWASGIASTLYQLGHTAHSVFILPTDDSSLESMGNLFGPNARANTDDGSDDEMPGLTLQEVPVDADMLVLSASAWRLQRERMCAGTEPKRRRPGTH